MPSSSPNTPRPPSIPLSIFWLCRAQPSNAAIEFITIDIEAIQETIAAGRIEGLTTMEDAPVVKDRHLAAAKPQPYEIIGVSRLRHEGPKGAVVVDHGLSRHVEAVGQMRIVADVDCAPGFIQTNQRTANADVMSAVVIAIWDGHMRQQIVSSKVPLAQIFDDSRPVSES